MACNCNRGGVPQKYLYTNKLGETFTYRTEMEAKAAKIRGGGGSVVAVPK